MLRFFFWVLLIANAGLFAYHQGYLGFANGHETDRLEAQINPEKIKLIPVASASASIAATPAAPLPDTKPEMIACTQVGNFTAPDAIRFEAALLSLNLGDRQSRHNVKEVASHMVYIPPLADKEAADKKASELRGMGVTNFYIMQENSGMKWGISLGVFKTEDAAQNHLDELLKAGIKSARVGARSVVTNRFAFQLRDLDPATRSSLDKIQAGFPNQAIGVCD
ncbi:MAG: SPOR domain-containing protein [Pseudomonadota bacterium]